MAVPSRWPRVLTPSSLRRMISQQKDPNAALRILDSTPPHLHTPQVFSSLLRLLPPSSPLLPSALLPRLLSLPYPLPPSLLSPLSHLLPPSLLPLLNSPDLSWPLHHHLLHRHSLPSALRLFSLLCGTHRVRPLTATINLLLSSLARASHLDVALLLFASMEPHLLCPPDRHTYRILMSALVSARRLDDAVHLLHSMLRRISQRGCEGDVVAYTTLLVALCEEERADEAELLLGKVLKKGLRVPRLRRAFQRPEIARGSAEDARRSIAEALAAGGVRSSASYRAVIAGLYEEGCTRDADRLFDEMRERGFGGRAEVYEARIAALEREGRVEDALGVLEEMRRGGVRPRAWTYELVMQGMCNVGKAGVALEVLRRMGRQGACSPRKESHEIVVEGLCREGRFVEAREVMEEMLRRRFYASEGVYVELVKGLAKVGRFYDSVVMLEEMVSQGKSPDVDMWRLLVPASCCFVENELLDFCADLG